MGYNLNRMVGEGLSEKGRFEQRSDRGERVSHETVEGRAFQAGGSIIISDTVVELGGSNGDCKVQNC